MSSEQVIAIFNALLTPTIAIVATYIAWQQWRINKQKFDLERYDRRLRIYEEVRKILSIVMRDARAGYEDLLRFRAAVSEADFLFGPEIPAYIDEIYKRGVQLEAWNQQYRHSGQEIPLGYDHQKVCDGMHKELEWLIAQFEPAKEKFKKYLHIGN